VTLLEAEKRARGFFARATPQSCRRGGNDHDEFWRINGVLWVQKCSDWPPEDKFSFGVIVQIGNEPCAPFSNIPGSGIFREG